MMIRSKNLSTRELFNAKIRTMFGKLDEKDIESIDGNTQALSSRLAECYGFSDAQLIERLKEFANHQPKAAAKVEYQSSKLALTGKPTGGQQ